MTERGNEEIWQCYVESWRREASAKEKKIIAYGTIFSILAIQKATFSTLLSSFSIYTSTDCILFSNFLTYYFSFFFYYFLSKNHISNIHLSQ
jgi:hypothetical protein